MSFTSSELNANVLHLDTLIMEVHANISTSDLRTVINKEPHLSITHTRTLIHLINAKHIRVQVIDCYLDSFFGITRDLC